MKFSRIPPLKESVVVVPIEKGFSNGVLLQKMWRGCMFSSGIDRVILLVFSRGIERSIEDIWFSPVVYPRRKERIPSKSLNSLGLREVQVKGGGFLRRNWSIMGEGVYSPGEYFFSRSSNLRGCSPGENGILLRDLVCSTPRFWRVLFF